MRRVLASCLLGLACLAVVGCGSSTSTTTVGAGGAVVVAVTSPTSGTVIAANNVTVRGTVSPPSATVEVQGKPAAVGNGVFTAEAVLHGGKTNIDVIGSASGETPGTTSVSVTRQSSGGSSSHRSGGGSSGGGGATPGIAGEQPHGGESSGGQTPCGGELAVGPDTTCAFAQNVRGAYERNGGGGTFEVYSPVTEKTYEMSCSYGTPVACRGGNNASVFFP